jgi:hypothetical protein
MFLELIATLRAQVLVGFDSTGAITVFPQRSLQARAVVAFLRCAAGD